MHFFCCQSRITSLHVMHVTCTVKSMWVLRDFNLGTRFSALSCIARLMTNKMMTIKLGGVTCLKVQRHLPVCSLANDPQIGLWLLCQKVSAQSKWPQKTPTRDSSDRSRINRNCQPKIWRSHVHWMPSASWLYSTEISSFVDWWNQNVIKKGKYKHWS